MRIRIGWSGSHRAGSRSLIGSYLLGLLRALRCLSRFGVASRLSRSYVRPDAEGTRLSLVTGDRALLIPGVVKKHPHDVVVTVRRSTPYCRTRQIDLVPCMVGPVGACPIFRDDTASKIGLC